MKRAENAGLFGRVKKIFKLEETEVGSPSPFVVSPYVAPVIDLRPNPLVSVRKRVYLQDFGDGNGILGGVTAITYALVDLPLPADQHGATNSTAGTTTSTTAEKVIDMTFVYPEQAIDNVRVRGNMIGNFLVGAVSNNASGVATITNIDMYLLEVDAAVSEKNRILTEGLVPNFAVTGTTEEKETMSVVSLHPDHLLDIENYLAVQVRVWATTNNVSYTTTAKLYYTAGSNDSYIDVKLI